MSRPLHSFVHLFTPTLRRSWAVAQNDHPGRIPSNHWPPALYVVDDLTLHLPLDLPPVTYTLAAGLVDENGQRLAVQGNVDSLMFLREVSISPLAAGRSQPLHPANATPAVFGQSLRLQGYDLRTEPEGPVVSLYWQVLGNIPFRGPTQNDVAAQADLVTFVHLLDEHDNRVAQFDGPPLEGLRPTSQWPPGALIVDQRQLRLPEGLPAGRYRILVGLYDPKTLGRAPVVPEAGAGGRFSGDSALVIPWSIE
jgi:hypothetical protein